MPETLSSNEKFGLELNPRNKLQRRLLDSMKFKTREERNSWMDENAEAVRAVINDPQFIELFERDEEAAFKELWIRFHEPRSVDLAA